LRDYLALPLPEGAPKLELKPVVLLLVTPVILTLLWYYGRLPFWRKSVAPMIFEPGTPDATIDFWGYYWLAGSSVVTRLLVPMAIILFVFKERLKDYGFRIKGTHKLGYMYLGLLCFMLPLLWYASSLPSFQNKYPLYDYVHSVEILLVYEISYILVFLSGEAFWRGFMVNALAPRFGLYSLLIMAIPYAMIHFGKPVLESFGAIIAGVVLGYLALKHRSFWLGVALHSTIGLTMDLMCLWRKGFFDRIVETVAKALT